MAICSYVHGHVNNKNVLKWKFGNIHLQSITNILNVRFKIIHIHAKHATLKLGHVNARCCRYLLLYKIHCFISIFLLYFRVQTRSSFSKLRSRFKRVTRKLIGASIYYGLMLNIGVVQSKALLCHICKSMLQGPKASQFWILFGALAFVFMILNCFLMEIARGLLTKSNVRRSPSLLYPNYLEPKYTRSGAIYGYIPRSV